MHNQIPQTYLATNWPIRYSSLSSDGRLIAVAGRRGLIHYSSTSGRWKVFADAIQEQAFSVRGGLLWFHHVLIAAIEISKSYQVNSCRRYQLHAHQVSSTDPSLFPRFRTQQPERTTSGSDSVARGHLIFG